ncbi:flippase [uncultured Chloroflexus sp.]|uniref:flippase n=1 Tax=uncultured Chloroflexus sp. TaxID=214040 RepID=UPI00261C5C68|nr:flippase [uncultured Chloroflexus sp.]
MQQSIGQQIARNSIAGVIGQITLRFISFGYTIAIVRQLGDENFGEYSTALALIGILTILADLGMANYVVREVAKDRNAISKLFGNMIVLRLILGSAVFFINILAGYILGYNSTIIFYIALGSIGLFLYALYGPLDAILQGLERIDLSVQLTIINQVIIILIGSVLLWQGWGVVGVFIASYIATIIVTVIAWNKTTKLTKLSINIDKKQWYALLLAGFPFAVTIFATMLSFKVDTVLLSLWRPSTEIGWYNAAYNLIFALISLSASFIGALVPSLSRHYQQDVQAVQQFFLQTVKILWIISLPISVGVTMESEKIVLLLYGSEYLNAARILHILIWVLPILNITALCGSITTVLHLERATARINLINALFNITLNLLIIPHFGVIGAAITTVITEFVGFVQYTWLLHDKIPIKNIISTFSNTIIPAGSMILVLWLNHHLDIFLTIPLAAVTYLGITFLTGGLRIAEVQIIVNTIAQALRKRAVASTK